MALVHDPPPPVTAPPNPVHEALRDPATHLLILRAARIRLRPRMAYTHRTQLEHAAEEIAARAEVLALEKAANFDESRGGVAVWIRGFVGKLVLQQFGRRRKNLGDQSLAQVADASPSAQGKLIRESERKAVQEALERIGSFDRRLVELCYFDGLPREEIARIVGISTVNVRVKLCRLRKELHTLLSPKIDGGQS